MKMNSNLRLPAALSFEGDVATNFKHFKQRFMLYMLAAGHTEKPSEVQVAIFLNIIGEEGLEKFNTFDLSEEQSKNLQIVMEAFEKYCVPKVSESVERHIFFNRNQLLHEGIDSYVTELKKLSASCEFGELRDSLIKDKIISGINDESLKDKLLNTEQLTLEKCISICKCVELTRTRLEKITLDSASPRTVGVVKGPIKEETRGGDESKIKVERWNSKDKGTKQKCDGLGQNYSYERLNRQPRKCDRCGREHPIRQCPAFDKRCRKCNIKGHFARFCKTRVVQYINSREEEEDEETYVLGTIANHEEEMDDWYENLQIKNSLVRVKLDTGAQVNVLPEGLCNSLGIQKVKSKVHLQNYNGTNIQVIGKCRESCTFSNGHQEYLDFEIVADCSGAPAILGLRTIKELKLIKRVGVVKQNDDIWIITEFQDLFTGLGEMEYIYDIKLKPNASPCQEPARRVAYKLMAPLKKELERMEKAGVIRKITQPTEWINALAIVKKPNNNIRLCLDPQRLNACIQREYYVMPTFEDLVARMPGAKYFSVLDGQNGFWHIKLSKKSQELTTFCTPYGRYCFKRLPFGLNSAPEVFYRCFKEIFEDLEGVEIYIDDLIVWATTEQEHDARLRKVLQRAREKHVKFNKSKCKFKVNKVKFVGHTLTDRGIQPDEEKVRAILEMKEPINKGQLETYLGTITYLAKFLPNLSQTAKPLRDLTRKDSLWEWTKQHSEIFRELNNMLTKQPILQYYDRNKPLVVAVDASKDGVGAVLMQQGLPVAYASKALTKTQTDYAQIEKEALAMVFGCERFHQYIYGTRFLIETDHQPLETIFKKTLQNCPMRIQRMKIRLQPYDFTVKYKPGKLMFLPDLLSRTYLENKDMELTDQDIDLHLHLIKDNLPMSTPQALKFQEETKKDEELQLVCQLLNNGWPATKEKVPELAKPYYTYKEELWELEGMLFKNDRVVVPRSMRVEMLGRIHYNHSGIEKCKARAREYMYWPSMNAHIDNMISNCVTCLQQQRKNPRESLILTKVPRGPWKVLASDIYTIHDKDYVIVVDYFSKFIEIEQLEDLMSETLIRKIKAIFSRHGIPEKLMTDGGPQYISGKFKEFARVWEFQHIMSSPHFSSSNGMAERHIQTAKNMIRKVLTSNRDPYLALLEWRSTPIASDIQSPAELLYNRKLKGLLPQVVDASSEEIEKVRTKLEERQLKQKYYHDKGARDLKPLEIGENVYMDNYQWKKSPLDEGKIVGINIQQPRSYQVLNNRGKVVNRNRRHLHHGSQIHPFTCRQKCVSVPDSIELSGNETVVERPRVQKEIQQPGTEETNSKEIYQTRSGRVVKKPVYLKDYIS